MSDVSLVISSLSLGTINTAKLARSIYIIHLVSKLICTCMIPYLIGSFRYIPMSLYLTR